MHCWLVTSLVLAAMTMVNTAAEEDPYWNDNGNEISSAIKYEEDPYWNDVGIEISSAIKYYNKHYAFKLMAAYAGDRPADKGVARKVYFTIKETECIIPLEQYMANCKFKDRGAMVDCAVYVPAEQSSANTVRCHRLLPGMQPLKPKNQHNVLDKPSETTLMAYLICCTLKLCNERCGK